MMGKRVSEHVSRQPSRTFNSHSGQRNAEPATPLRELLMARLADRQAAARHDTVREARGYIRGFDPTRAVSKDTAVRYASTLAYMNSKGESPEDAACKASFEFRRAALIHETRTNIKSDLRDLDRAKRQGDGHAERRAISRVQASVEILRRYPPSTGKLELDVQRRSAYCGPKLPEHSNSKRSSVWAIDLPADWKDRMQRAAGASDRPAFSAMALTGCRPVEVRGIKVRQDEHHLTLTIKGAKVDDTRGVAVREVTFDKAELAQTLAGRHLQAWLGERPVRTVSYRGSCEALRDRVARTAERAGLEDVTSYSYRHAAARELRANGASRAEITARLGHRAERSQRNYG